MKALSIETTDEQNVLRAIIFDKHEDGFICIDNMAEGEYSALLEWFTDNGSDCHYFRPTKWGREFECPDCLSVWEAACAVAGL